MNKPPIIWAGLTAILLLAIIAFSAIALAPWEEWKRQEEERDRQIEDARKAYDAIHPTCCWKGLVIDTREYSERPGIFDRPRQDVTIKFLEGPGGYGSGITVTIECTYYRTGDIIEKIDRGDDFYDGILGEHWRLWGLPSKCDYVRA